MPFVKVLSPLKENTKLTNKTFFADYGQLSWHEEYIVHHSGSRGQKSVRLHRQGRENGEALLSRVQGGIHCKSIPLSYVSVRVAYGQTVLLEAWWYTSRVWRASHARRERCFPRDLHFALRSIKNSARPPVRQLSWTFIFPPIYSLIICIFFFACKGFVRWSDNDDRASFWGKDYVNVMTKLGQKPTLN